jgi:hypothetical protein
VEQELNTKQQLAAWMANPENINGENAAVLGSLAEKYPYFQPLHLLLAKAAFIGAGHSPELATAALYNGGQLVHRVIHSPQQLSDKDFHIVSYTAEILSGEPEPLEESGIDEVMSVTEVQVDEQETFDEIGEINIEDYRQEGDTFRQGLTGALAEPQVLQLTHETLDPEFETMAPPAGIEDENAFENDLVLENIVSTDFFAFQDNFKVEDVLDPVPQIEEYSEQAALEQENVISKYDDDKLPYTFLWWLAKTRKEHQQIFQPYASPKQQKAGQPVNQTGQNATGELQQQYVENIFHMQSAFGDEDPGYIPVGFRRNAKGDEIIESFIKNEPQISPPKPEQINNENKARKSSEDHSDMVSETLAKIYIEQMLYDKAIETYEKLSLMFPEKSRYFADLIQSIEKKI